MPEIAAEKKGSRNPEVPADIVILLVLMSMQSNTKANTAFMVHL